MQERIQICWAFFSCGVEAVVTDVEDTQDTKKRSAIKKTSSFFTLAMYKKPRKCGVFKLSR